MSDCGVVASKQEAEKQGCIEHLSVNTARETVLKHFPHLWPAVEAGLSASATLLLSDNANPVALIYVGPPSSGKTTVVTMFDRTKVNGERLCYRSDKFTPAAFVSQAANVKTEQLKTVDLLPRIQHKVLLTPELSTIFRGKPDELAERFSTITRVLDGQGLLTDSGTHGQRGYEGDYLFAWLGATTPFDSVVWKVMAQLGSRMFFLVMDSVATPSIEELVHCNCNLTPYSEGLRECQSAVGNVLTSVFEQYGGVRKVQWNPFANLEHVIEGVARCATLLATMRTPYSKEETLQQESPHRANAVLYNIARGHALIWGRLQLTEEDLPLVAQVTMSSILRNRRALFQALVRDQECRLTVAKAQVALGVSLDTARKAMEEMGWLGIARFIEPGTGKPAYLTLEPNWSWCADDNFRPLLVGQS